MNYYANPSIKYFPDNLVGRDFVVGDIHGEFHLLEDALRNVNFNFTKDRLFSVGDLVDRGRNSGDCLNYLKQPWFHAVIGNHEMMLIDYYERRIKDQTNDYIESHYEANGGGWAIRLEDELLQKYAKAFSEMPFAFEIQKGDKRIGIVHAEVPLDDWNFVSKPTQVSDELATTIVWSRRKITSGNSKFVKNIDVVYVGHTVLKETAWLGNVKYIDIGAVFTGNLHLQEI